MARDYVLKNNIAYYRRKKGLSQFQLAFICGVSKNTISCLERGFFCPSAYLGAKLCIIFDVKFDELFYLDDCDDALLSNI